MCFARSPKITWLRRPRSRTSLRYLAGDAAAPNGPSEASRRQVDEALERSRLDIIARDFETFTMGREYRLCGRPDDLPPCHVHLIPQRSGDIANPRGEVRAVIPGKALC